MDSSKENLDKVAAKLKIADKLEELDTKVSNYQKEMLNHFHSFSMGILRDVPADLQSELLNYIERSLPKYPFLCGVNNVPESPATHTTPEQRNPRSGHRSPPPILHHTSGIPRDRPPPMLHHTSGIPRDRPRSPHAREKEFQGLFTPAYLPLLDGSDRPPFQPQTIPVVPILPSDNDTDKLAQPSGSGNTDDDNVPVVEEVEEVEEVEKVDKGKGKEVIRPSSARTLTDVSISSSVGSSSSETKSRRSALRRSSSSARGSPRRVRFEVAGTEVLPTASPQPSASILASMGSEASTSAIDDSPEYKGLSLGDVAGEEDSVPRPPRISSTEKLRQLSRAPLEKSTFWSHVNAFVSAKNKNVTPLQFNDGHGWRNVSSAAVSHNLAGPSGTGSPLPPHQHADPLNGSASRNPGSPLEELDEQADEEVASEEEVLSMKPGKRSASLLVGLGIVGSPGASNLTSQIMEEEKAPPALTAEDKGKGKKNVPAPLAEATEPNVARPPLASDPSSQILEEASRPGMAPTAEDKGKGKKNVVPGQQADEEDLFGFEDQAIGPGTTEKYLPEEEDEPAAEETTEAEEEAARVQPPLYSTSTSPARSIPKPLLKASGSPSLPSKAMHASIGSYKGAPLRMGVVTNPKVQAEAEAMGDVRTYVGSIHGRTGIDPTDESSYRASLSGNKMFSGTPRSFSERMMIEESLGEGEEGEEERETKKGG